MDKAGLRSELAHVVKKFKKNNIYKILLDASITKKLYTENEYHIVILNKNLEAIYDSFFDVPMPSYKDNPAVLCAVKTKDEGEFEINVNGETEYYYAVYLGGLVVMISSDTKESKRNQAWQRLLNMDQAWMALDARYAANQMSPNGLFCAPGGCTRGRENIYKSLLEYTTSGIDRDVRLIQKSFFFDPITNGGVLERTWTAIDTATDRRYEQDDAIVIKLDSDGFLLYHREYFDPAQRLANYEEPAQADPKDCNGGNDNGNCKKKCHC
ncbi:hypothetical protein QJ857_gp0712 [Tupanvirus soda lake]|uniref:Uncharacterized protein n=2 Tax=Tupanvirus TaxID=2094720 RepID=A0A6N1NLE4_9VIRU|nr:hypothetical protein QJ857_gp0712 [Tupanvirus soda lake]QKU35335.1 hypothetical protein [Tupanvirus soda lake]